MNSSDRWYLVARLFLTFAWGPLPVAIGFPEEPWCWVGALLLWALSIPALGVGIYFQLNGR